MSQCDSDKNDFERLQSALQMLDELEEEIDKQNDVYSQLVHAKDIVSMACNKLGRMGQNNEVERALGKTASIAIQCGRDDLAGTALEIGSELHG